MSAALKHKGAGSVWAAGRRLKHCFKVWDNDGIAVISQRMAMFMAMADGQGGCLRPLSMAVVYGCYLRLLPMIVIQGGCFGLLVEIVSFGFFSSVCCLGS
ncbi:MAG: hypothetical protein COB04_19215 [Gammaproteobacteria bacterium]|nr:MAG: hypothetical protein COB04_19215 [Gammaproteobacteria bacterium]